MERGRDFRGRGGGRRRHATDEDQGFPGPPLFQAQLLLVQRQPPAGDGTPIAAIVKWFDPEKGFGFVEIGDGFGANRLLTVNACHRPPRAVGIPERLAPRQWPAVT
jgi:hypothetical protein